MKIKQSKKEAKKESNESKKRESNESKKEQKKTNKRNTLTQKLERITTIASLRLLGGPAHQIDSPCRRSFAGTGGWRLIPTRSNRCCCGL
jgi:hypothetical protein